MRFAGIWMDVGMITLSGVIKTHNDRHCMFSLIGRSYLQIIRCEFTTWSNCSNQKSKNRPRWGGWWRCWGIIERKITADLEEDMEKQEMRFNCG